MYMNWETSGNLYPVQTRPLLTWGVVHLLLLLMFYTVPQNIGYRAAGFERTKIGSIPGSLFLGDFVGI
jgi:hypothetical protein